MVESSKKTKFVLRRPSRLLRPLGRALTVGSVLLGGCALSVGAYFAASQLEQRDLEVRFVRDAEERVSSFKVALARSLSSVIALRAFFDSSEKVEETEFRRFAGHLLQENPAVQALGWNPLVLDSGRGRFEAEQQLMRPGFTITELSEAGEMVPAARRERYIVVSYLEPYEGNEAALGYDIGSDPIRLQALRTAETTGHSAITAGLRLVQESGEQTGVLAVLPRYAVPRSADAGGRPEAELLGFLVAVLRPVDILESALEGFAPRGLHFSIHDITDDAGVLLYAHRSRRNAAAGGDLDEGAIPFKGIFYEEQLEVSARRWSVRAAPTAAYVAERRIWVPTGALIVGLLFSGLLAGFVRQALDRLTEERDQTERLLEVSRTLEHEIEEHRRTEVALTASEERHRNVVEAMFEGIAISEDGIFIEVSESLSGLFGYEEEEVLGQPVLKMVAPEEHATVTENMMTGFEQPYETLCVKKDGTVFPVEVCGKQSTYRGRQVRLTAIRDISERKRLEQEVLRGRKLESLGVLAGGLAHDFNNLLTGVMGAISLARLEPDEEEKEVLLEEAERAALRSRDLTQQLLTFARGGAPITQLTALGELVREAAGFAVRGTNVRCEFKAQDDLWGVEVDPGQMNQVIHNLVLNAVQAMPRGGVVEVHCRNIEIQPGEQPLLAAGRYVEISVEDHGIGIPPEHLGDVFDPYFTTKQSGSGLGLATAFSIVKRHSGLMDLKSESGRGTIVTTLIPAAGMPVSGREVEAGLSERGSGSVLVMDDEKTIRTVLTAMLENLGYTVTCVETGEEAITVYRAALDQKEPFAACVMDLTVPGAMGGREALEHLLEIDPEIRAIVSSGYSNDPVMAHYEEHGFCEVMTKPYRLQDVGRVMRRATMQGVAPAARQDAD